jgi:DnaJ-class molecular chaperone
MEKVTCPICKGSGKRGHQHPTEGWLEYPCYNCNGSGKVIKQDRPVRGIR